MCWKELLESRIMKTKVFETGAVCAAVALLVVFSLPAYAKSGGSGAQTRVSKTTSNSTSVKPVTSSRTVKKSQTKTCRARAVAKRALAPPKPPPFPFFPPKGRRAGFGI